MSVSNTYILGLRYFPLTLNNVTLFLLNLALLSLALEAFGLERRVDDHGLSACGDRLGVRGTTLGLVRGTNLAGGLGQHVQTIEIWAIWKGRVRGFAFTTSRARVFVGIALGQVWKFMESKEHTLAVTKRNGLAFLDQVVRQAVDTTLGELFATGLARMLVPVAGVLEFGASNEELEDECVGFAPHCGRRGREEEGGVLDAYILKLHTGESVTNGRLHTVLVR